VAISSTGAAGGSFGIGASNWCGDLTPFDSDISLSKESG
jgi:hypothetical protein